MGVNQQSGASRRRNGRSRSASARVLRLGYEEGAAQRWLTADLIDFSDGGIGIATAFPLAVGSTLTVNGRVDGEDRRRNTSREAHVCWCLEKDDGTYRAGLAFEDAGGPEHDTWESHPSGDTSEPEKDHYETLQLSPSAHPDTVHRVYRLLAQRYHPDNTATGDEEMFKQVLAAYRILKDPESRAAYDAQHAAVRRRRWRLFESAADANGIDAEKRKRQSALFLLYSRRIQDPEHPVLTIHELEDVLGCPRDHLEVTLWYLKEKRHIHRDDRGRYEITVDGVDVLEQQGAVQPRSRPLLNAGGKASTGTG